MDSFAYINGELINLYSKENPILEADDICYGLIFNIDDYHRPIMIKGVIVEDTFVNGMNKQYDIRIIEILESPKTINEFVIGKQFVMTNKDVVTKRNTLITNNFNFNKYVIKLDAYFVRNSESEILKLRNEYIQIVRNDLQKMISDLNSI